MKKNAMLKIAAILLVAVLLTTCAISSTFAKYSSDFEGVEETARVAKWDVEASLAATSDTLFLSSYKIGTTPYVTAADSKNVIAPGTSDSVTYKATITNNGEVSVAGKYDPTVTLTGFETYCPLVFKVNNGTDITAATGTALATAVQNAIIAASASGIENNAELTISWRWAYDGVDGANDENDTALGTATTAPTVTINVGLTVYQTGPAVAEG